MHPIRAFRKMDPYAPFLYKVTYDNGDPKITRRIVDWAFYPREIYILDVFRKEGDGELKFHRSFPRNRFFTTEEIDDLGALNGRFYIPSLRVPDFYGEYIGFLKELAKEIARNNPPPLEITRAISRLVLLVNAHCYVHWWEVKDGRGYQHERRETVIPIAKEDISGMAERFSKKNFYLEVESETTARESRVNYFDGETSIS